MDTLRINSIIEKKSFIKIQLIIWELITLKSFRRFKISGVIALLILLIGIALEINGSESASVILFFGYMISVMPVSILYARIRSKKRYRNRIENIEINAESNKNSFYEFSDNALKYEDDEKKWEYKWSVFTCYSVYKNHIVLMMNDSMDPFCLFGKLPNDDTEYNKILEFVKAKLPFKTVK